MSLLDGEKSLMICTTFFDTIRACDATCISRDKICLDFYSTACEI